MPATTAAEQVRTELLRLIAERSPGDRLPSSRQLVERLRISPLTLSTALSRLAAEGLVITQPGSGTFVARTAHSPAPPLDADWQTVVLGEGSVDLDVRDRLRGGPSAGRFALDGGYLHDALRPNGLLAGALGRAARRPEAWGRAPAAGVRPLRELAAADSGADVQAEDVIVTSGGQNALSLILRSVGTPGDAVVVESPTYPGALAAIRAAGLRPIPVPLDEQGMRVDVIDEILARSGARIVYCQPNHHNPTGITMSAQRRAALLAALDGRGVFVIEDDFARFLGHDPEPRTSLLSDDRTGCVIQVTSLTKPAAPSLRIGAIVARGPVMSRLQAARYVDDFFVSVPLQESAVELLASPGWQRHRKALAKALAERRSAAVRQLATVRPEWTVTPPRGGLHLWARLAEGERSAQVVEAALSREVSIADGDRFFPAEPGGAFVRIAIAATPDVATLEEGVRRLASR